MLFFCSATAGCTNKVNLLGADCARPEGEQPGARTHNEFTPSGEIG